MWALSLDPFLLVFDGDSKTFFQQRQLTDKICDGISERLLRAEGEKKRSMTIDNQ